MITDEYQDERIIFLQLHLGGDRNFSYLFGDRASGAAAAVDPGYKAARFAAAAAERSLEIRHILITHAHSDHTGQARELAKLTGAAVYAGEGEEALGAKRLRDGQHWSLGEQHVLSIHTPGHSPGHFCFLFEGRLMTGDLLFCGKVGGTGPYFPDSSAEQEWSSLQRIIDLPEDTLVYPGHDYYGGEGTMPRSTIGFEKRNNPFLRCESLEAFVRLKENWDAYKREHGIR